MSCQTCETVTDIDGNVYKTIKIGDQIWMAENLRVTHYINGDAIKKINYSRRMIPNGDGEYCAYDNFEINADTFGYLYNWYAVTDSRKIAPEGWHVPTDEEIKQLEMTVGMSESEANDSLWRGTNEGEKLAGFVDLWDDGWHIRDSTLVSSGFDFLPGGCIDKKGFTSLGYVGCLWSSTEFYIRDTAMIRLFNFSRKQIYRDYHAKGRFCSVRCVRD